MTSIPPQFNLIAGLQVGAVGGRALDVLDPSTGEVFTTLPRSDARDIDAAVAAARSAYQAPGDAPRPPSAAAC